MLPIAVIPETVVDRKSGHRYIEIDIALVNSLKEEGRNPLVIPLLDDNGDVDQEALSWITSDSFSGFHAPESLLHGLEMAGLQQDNSSATLRRWHATNENLPPRVVVIPDLRDGKIRLAVRFIDALRRGAKALPIIATCAERLGIEYSLADAAGFMVPGSDSHYHPSRWGEEATYEDALYDKLREQLVQAVVEMARAYDIPYFGICSGMQGYAVFSDDNVRLHQDSEHGKKHRRQKQRSRHLNTAHIVHFGEGMFITRLMGANHAIAIPVNSAHVQTIDATSLPGDITVDGIAKDDGEIEAIHARYFRYHIGVQFHPEVPFMSTLHGVISHHREIKLYNKLFKAFSLALRGWSWEDIITHGKLKKQRWRNRGMAWFGMVPIWQEPKPYLSI